MQLTFINYQIFSNFLGIFYKNKKLSVYIYDIINIVQGEFDIYNIEYSTSSTYLTHIIYDISNIKIIFAGFFFM